MSIRHAPYVAFIIGLVVSIIALAVFQPSVHVASIALAVLVLTFIMSLGVYLRR